MNARQPDGSTLRQHYAVIAARRRRMPEAAIPPEVPGPAMYLWEWFLELARCRSSSGFGPGAISWQDIDAWARRTNVDPTPFEIDCLVAIDSAYLNATHSSTKAKGNGD